MVLGLIRICCAPFSDSILGFMIIGLVLAGPILMLVGGLMFAVHQPHRLIAGNGTLVGVQSDRYWPTPLPDTYSWCRYSMLVDCPQDGDFNVPARARRDDTAYNGLRQVPASRCFEDAEILNYAEASPGVFSPDTCLQPDGAVTCANPFPVIRAFYDQDGCSNGVWTLNDPQESMTRFIIILSVGGGCFAIGWGVLLAAWLARGCPSSSDELY